MSWLSDWLDRLSGRSRPKPKPTPVVDGTWVPRGLAAINSRRAERGAGPLQLDPGLCAAAAVLAPGLADGTKQPHDGFPDRVRLRGWPYEDKGIRNRGFGNVSEGNSEGGMTPEEAVLILDNSPDPNEGHRRDFEDPRMTHVGIAYAKLTAGPLAKYGGFAAVVDWGAR